MQIEKWIENLIYWLMKRVYLWKDPWEVRWEPRTLTMECVDENVKQSNNSGGNVAGIYHKPCEPFLCDSTSSSFSQKTIGEPHNILNRSKRLCCCNTILNTLDSKEEKLFWLILSTGWYMRGHINVNNSSVHQSTCFLAYILFIILFFHFLFSFVYI